MVRRPSGAVAGEISHLRNRPRPAAPTNSPRFRDDFSAHQRDDRPALDRLALVGRVIHRVVDHRLLDGDFFLRIPDRQVRVAADRDGPLARMETVELGGVGRGQRDELWKIDASLADAFREQERGPHFEAGNAIRHLLERRIAAVLHLSFRVVVAVAGVIGREYVEHAGRKPLPDHVLVRLVAGRRDCTCIWRPRSPAGRDHPR